MTLLDRIPVVAGLAYIERVRQLPPTFTAWLHLEPENKYFLNAVSVHVNEQKVGYLAPEISRRYVEPLQAHAEPVSCPGRHASHSDHETSGVELLLDFGSLPLRAAE